MKRRKFLKALGAVAGMAAMPVVPMVAAIKPVPMITMVRYTFVHSKDGLHYYYVLEGPARDELIQQMFAFHNGLPQCWRLCHTKVWQVRTLKEAHFSASLCNSYGSVIHGLVNNL